MNESLSLTELNNYFKEIIEANFPDEIWVIAEISEINVNAKGHCYIDFIERDELTKRTIARQRATVWAFQYRLVKGHFESLTGQELTKGLKILVKVRINYHVLYGLSLNVVDIDPSYTLGEQERHRLEIIKRLEEEGVTDMNKGLSLTTVPQRLAIISSDTAAGYGDFINQIEQNANGYSFTYELFSASMQGEATSSSVVQALSDIYEREHEFDVVLIIRGGGAKAELAAFDDYDIAFMVSQSPLPVLTGIGHERDESVTDLVAWQKFKTPTAVAVFLQEKMEDYEAYLDNMASQLQALSQAKLEQYVLTLNNLQYSFKSATSAHISKRNNKLSIQTQQLSHVVQSFVQQYNTKLSKQLDTAHNVVNWQLNRKMMKLGAYQSNLRNVKSQFLSREDHKLAIFQEKAAYNNPQKMLRNGYGYVTREGKRITKSAQIQVNDNVRIAFFDGKIDARVTKVEKDKSE